MEILLVLNGAVLATAITLGVIAWRSHLELKIKRELITTQMEHLVKSIVDAHNALNQTIAVMDKKLTETSLRVDTLTLRKPGSVARFPGNV